MPEMLYEIVIYLLAVYGAIALAMNMLNPLYRRAKVGMGNVKLILAVKDQEDTVEGMVRNLFESELLPSLVPDNTLTVVEMGSTDETLKLLSKLKQEYGAIEIVTQNEKEKIFSGFGQQ